MDDKNEYTFTGYVGAPGPKGEDGVSYSLDFQMQFIIGLAKMTSNNSH